MKPMKRYERKNVRRDETSGKIHWNYYRNEERARQTTNERTRDETRRDETNARKLYDTAERDPIFVSLP